MTAMTKYIIYHWQWPGSWYFLHQGKIDNRLFRRSSYRPFCHRSYRPLPGLSRIKATSLVIFYFLFMLLRYKQIHYFKIKRACDRGVWPKPKFLKIPVITWRELN